LCTPEQPKHILTEEERKAKNLLQKSKRKLKSARDQAQVRPDDDKETAPVEAVAVIEEDGVDKSTEAAPLDVATGINQDVVEPSTEVTGSAGIDEDVVEQSTEGTGSIGDDRRRQRKPNNKSSTSDSNSIKPHIKKRQRCILRETLEWTYRTKQAKPKKPKGVSASSSRQYIAASHTEVSLTTRSDTRSRTR
jgi:hypothetical protein